MQSRTILVSGLGVAGATLAYWLRRHGFSPTVVERAPAPREGGYILDFWGVGFEVAEKMGVVPTLLREGYDMKGMRFVDRHGARICTIDVQSFRAVLADRYVSILRSGLAKILLDALDVDVERRFGDTVQTLEQHLDHVSVTFAGGDRQDFDLVIGADGLHSAVRALAFGPEAQFEQFYGYYAASFTIDDYPHRDPDTYVSFTVPGKQVARYLLRDGRTAVLLVFRQDLRLPHVAHDVAAQRQLLRDVYGGEGWECAALLGAMESASDLYFDAVSQIRMPWWSVGRVALVGDACFCPSLLSGQGSAIAMAGAYILAGELKAAAGDPLVAFTAYERRLRKFVQDKQATAEQLAGSFVPATRLGLWTRNQVSRLMFLPIVARWFGKRFLVDPLALADYEAT